ncbi:MULTISPECIES: PA3496 family putative envelope integrity protein [Shewanella]|uniref:PA3496 family putative envelope integrity protein n=1 Tax=Shewanella TaxID=22 RepID=UPI0013EEC8A0|nr:MULTISPECIES: hypothetical protein [Shewanella]
MANLTEHVPNDTELEEMAKPRNVKKAQALEHKRAVRRKLDDYLEDAQLRRDIEDDFM